MEAQHPIAGPAPLTELAPYVTAALSGGQVVVFHTERKCMERHKRNTYAVMTKLISPVRGQTIKRGNSDYAEREKERLTKRANEHWNRVGRSEAIAKAEAKGNPVPTPWLRKEVSRVR